MVWSLLVVFLRTLVTRHRPRLWNTWSICYCGFFIPRHGDLKSMLDGPKDNLKLEAMKRIISASENSIFSFSVCGIDLILSIAWPQLIRCLSVWKICYIFKATIVTCNFVVLEFRDFGKLFIFLFYFLTSDDGGRTRCVRIVPSSCKECCIKKCRGTCIWPFILFVNKGFYYWININFYFNKFILFCTMILRQR